VHADDAAIARAKRRHDVGVLHMQIEVRATLLPMASDVPFVLGRKHCV
jgi:hypothetical protein